MHRSNNAVIMQTEQLGRIEALEEELRSSRGKVADMEQKVMEQDRVIAQLVGDNLDHLQDNMRLTAHINSSTERMAQMEHRLGQVGSVVMGFCHRYDFLVRLWNGLNFFELFKLLFSLGIDHDPHVLYVHMTYVYPFFLCFTLHTITWPREVIIVL